GIPYAPGLLVARLTVRFRLGPSRSPVPEGGSSEAERRIPPNTRAGARVCRRRLALPVARAQLPQRHADAVRPRAPLRPGGGHGAAGFSHDALEGKTLAETLPPDIRGTLEPLFQG